MFLRPLRLVFEAVLHSFLNESEPRGYIVSSMKFTYLLSTTKVQNSEIFSPRMSTKCKIFSRILFADQKRKIRLKPFFFSSPLFDLTLLPVYIMTVIKVKLRVELYLFLLASKIFSSFRVAPAISVIRKILITENTKATTCHIIYRYGYQSLLYDILRL